MSDRWRPTPSRAQRLARAQKSTNIGTVDGRVAQARPVPVRGAVDKPAAKGLFEIYIQPNEPTQAGYKALWFDTDDVVPGT